MTDCGRGIQVRPRWLIAIALFLTVGFAAGAVALATGRDDVAAQIAALDAKYRALPNPSTVEEALQRNWDYEREFATIGGEAPNGKDELTPADYEDHALPDGIHAATEDVAAFHLVNLWSGEVGGEQVVVASATPESTPGQGGVIVFDSRGRSSFIAAPRGVIGALTIVSVSGTKLELSNPNGIRVAFDAALRAFV
jgi:hypothetical protein